MVWKIDNPQCNESKKIVWEVAPYLRGRGLDIGAGDFKILPHAISVDNMNHEQFGFNVKPDILCEADKLDLIASASVDWVYSSHTLEHVEDMAATLKEWWRVIKQNGLLILYLPHADFYPNIGEKGANPDHKRDFRPADVIGAMPNGWELLERQNRNEDQEYSFLLVFKKIGGRENRTNLPNPNLKTALVVRYGAYGDLMQASSVIKGLKGQGYHVTLHSAAPGCVVMEHDPNIDRMIVFDKDQVPNANLSDFWAWQKKKYDKFVNLSESVEGSLLAMPGRAMHGWDPVTREVYTKLNYLEFQHMIAGIPHKPQVKFYPTIEERNWAKTVRSRMAPGPVVMYSLAGSSVHKTWAGMDNVIAGVMLHSDETTVVLVGGPECVILEQGWEKEKRVARTSGKWSIRQTLAFLDQTDILIGPETGVLNAASCMMMPKIVLLSHSSHLNLTRDWVNVHPIWSKESTCSRRKEAEACHSMNYGWAVCEKDEVTSTAKCQAEIDPQDVYTAMEECLTALSHTPTIREHV
jgi:ADP-heptose:LPS heptosyltransferase